MSKKIYENKDVIPGEKLSVIEAFRDGEGAYRCEGQVRSSELGIANFDFKNKQVTVNKKTKKLVLPQEGVDVLADVGSVLRRDARVDVFSIDKKVIPIPYTGVIHISDVSKDYVKDMTMAMRNGDIVKAKIINTKNRLIQLSTSGSEYGVIYAYCSTCGMLMDQVKNRLQCSKCSRIERRKISKTYGSEELV